MSRKIILDKERLNDLYCVKMLSQKDVAKELGCSIDTVRQNLRDYNIDSHTRGSWNQSNIIVLNDEQKEILNGAMLGDGSLVVAKKGVNAQFTYTSKSKQHIEFVSKEFMQYSYSEGIKHYKYTDKRTNKMYERYTFRTITDKGLTEFYNEWYVDRIKHLPKSLTLTPTTCLIWYIGDGGICNSSKHNGQCIKLATNCFKKEEQETILLPQLINFEARLCLAGKGKHNNEQQYAIFIPRKHMRDFLDYIGECPFEDYQHKWNVKETLYNSYENSYKDWEDMYVSGVTYNRIAKEYNADPTTVLKHLQKVGIYKKFVGYKQFYKQWEERYLNGESYSEIANDYDCCTQTVLHHLRQIGIYKEKGNM